MNRATQVLHLVASRATVGLYSPSESEVNVARWKINGYPAAIVIWTAEEWEKLTVRPSDAQYFPCGVWCALRME